MWKKGAAAIIAMATIICACAALTFLSWTFSESLALPRPSLRYSVMMHSNVIHRFPIVMPVNDASYTYSCGDGPKPPFVSVDYETAASSQQITAILHDYLGAYEFAIISETEGKKELEFRAPHCALLVTVEEQEDRVTVSALEMPSSW